MRELSDRRIVALWEAGRSRSLPKRAAMVAARVLERRDDWLAPLSMGKRPADDPESSKSGVRASDKGFLNINLSDYVRLLCWTTKQRSTTEQNLWCPAVCKAAHSPPDRSVDVARFGLEFPTILW